MLLRVIFSFSILIVFADHASAMEFRNTYFSGDVLSRTWKALRDERVKKQELDDSCGAASLATIITVGQGLAATALGNNNLVIAHQIFW